VSKEVIGFNLSFHHNGELVLKTVKEAALKTGRFPRIFHSDRGSENLAQICRNYLEANGVQVLVSDPGIPGKTDGVRYKIQNVILKNGVLDNAICMMDWQVCMRECKGIDFQFANGIKKVFSISKCIHRSSYYMV
jgi:transposase InsO family protein